MSAQYPNKGDLPIEIRTAIDLWDSAIRASLVTKKLAEILNWTWCLVKDIKEKVLQCLEEWLPSEIQERYAFLRNISYVLAEGLRNQDPEWSREIIGQIYWEITKLPDPEKNALRFSRDYLRFLAEYISTAEYCTDFTLWDIVATELEWSIQYHLWIIFGEKVDWYSSRELIDKKIHEEDIPKYRHKLLNAVSNLAWYYARSGNVIWYSEAYAKTVILSKLFCSAQITFDALILELTVEESNWVNAWELSVPLSETRECLMGWLLPVYWEGNINYLRSRAKLEIMELLIAARSLRDNKSTNVSQIAEILEKRISLMEFWDIWYEELEGLIHIEILLYIAIDRLIHDPDKLAESIEKFPNECMIIFQSAINKVNTTGLDINKMLRGWSAGLFLRSIIDLFAHGIDSIKDIDAGSYESISFRKRLIHKMLLIYDIMPKHVGGLIWLSSNPLINRFYQLSLQLIAILFPNQFWGVNSIDIGKSIKFCIWVIKDPRKKEQKNPLWELLLDILWITDDEPFQLREVSAVFEGIEAKALNIPKIRFSDLNKDFLDQCSEYPWIIQFDPIENGGYLHNASIIHTSDLEDGSKIYTLRFGISINTPDSFPRFTGITEIYISPEGKIRRGDIISKYPRNQDAFERQADEIIWKIWGVEKSIDSLASRPYIYEDTYGTIYQVNRSISGKYVYIVKTNNSFRCEINTYKEWWAWKIYIGAMLNQEWWDELNDVLAWLGGIINASIKITPYSFPWYENIKIDWFRDDSHKKHWIEPVKETIWTEPTKAKTGEMTVDRFRRMTSRRKGQTNYSPEVLKLLWSFLVSLFPEYPID